MYVYVTFLSGNDLGIIECRTASCESHCMCMYMHSFVMIIGLRCFYVP